MECRSQQPSRQACEMAKEPLLQTNSGLDVRASIYLIILIILRIKIMLTIKSIQHYSSTEHLSGRQKLQASAMHHKLNCNSIQYKRVTTYCTAALLESIIQTYRPQKCSKQTRCWRKGINKQSKPQTSYSIKFTS